MDEAWRDELREFIAIPSVSADPAHQDDLRRAAEWVRDFVKRAGGEAELVPYGTRDLVIGDIPANADGVAAPTVLIYGHFDVQPPAPLELWESPPFELEERDGWFYARGIASLQKLPSGAEILLEAGATPLDAQAEQDFYDRTWAEPSLDINGIYGGKPEFVNTTLVVEAEARFTIRLAPGQDPDTIAAAAERLFRAAVPDGARVEMERENSAPPGVFAPD